MISEKHKSVVRRSSPSGRPRFASHSFVVHRIEIQNLNKKYRIDCKFIKKITDRILRHVKLPWNTEIEIVFLDDSWMRRLNKKYKHKDRPTDVLSFPIETEEFKPHKFFGEVFISLDEASKNSAVFGTRFEEEIVLYIIHGILHLARHGDETPKDKRRMSQKEKTILGELCRREDLSRVLTRR